MTSVVRYITNKTTGANGIQVGSTGKDYQLIAYDLTLGAEIAAKANADILNYTGSGQIKTMISYQVKGADGSIRSPAPDLEDIVKITNSGTTINVAVADGGVPIAANSLISLLLVIGSY